MLRVNECREFAAKCRVMARSARDKVQKAQFLRLADQWDSIARTRQKFLNLKLKRKAGKSRMD